MALAGTTLLAHETVLTAEIICDETSGLTILYTASSLIPGQTHPQIEIRVNGVLVDTGAYTDPDYEFSGTAPLPPGSVAGDVITVTATAVGPWGDGFAGGQVASVDVVVPEGECTGLGRFTGGGHQIRVGEARVTRGLTLHCDLLLSNNLEVNWGGNKFHMLEHLTTVSCIDDPEFDPTPPPAPIDTLIGVGTGRYNGVDGYTIEFTLIDDGEPGSGDMMAIKIYETADPLNVVLDVPLQFLTGGNLQAHYDQPHK
jgi:hypothetical protein